MNKPHFIFLHESDGNKPMTINAEYLLYATREDDKTTVVMGDYYDSMIYDSEYSVNETPEKIFTLLPVGMFALLHDSESNKVILVNLGGSMSCVPNADGGTDITLVLGETLTVNETPMRIHDIITSGKQAKTIKPKKTNIKKEEQK